jgi:hypothetical protein
VKGIRYYYYGGPDALTLEDVPVARQLLENELVRPVIDRTYSLSEVPGDVRYVEQGHAAGKVVIKV